MSSESASGAGLPLSSLTRADIELLLRKEQPASPVDLSFQNLQHCNLSYLDLRGANLRGTNLQGANLRGAILSQADLREANFSDADLDGADLSGALLGEHEANRVVLHRANLSYTTLRGLDLRGFDLSGLDLHGADLNRTDLRHVVLHGTNLQGADLSTAQLYGPELRGAILHREQLWSAGEKQSGRNKTPGQRPAQVPLTRLHVQPSSSRPKEDRLSDREAFLIGERAWLPDADPVKTRQFFPQGFTFTRARSLFDTWLAQTGTRFTDHEMQAIWIGFASCLCRLYHEEPPEV